MICSRKLMLWGLAFVFICLTLPRHAYAYVDPGTGSYILQLFLAALFGALFALKVFWTKIKSAFARVRGTRIRQ
jgi:hypothetical protein